MAGVREMYRTRKWGQIVCLVCKASPARVLVDTHMKITHVKEVDRGREPQLPAGLREEYRVSILESL